MKIKKTLLTIISISLLITACGSSDTDLDSNGNPITSDFQSTTQESPVTSEKLTELMTRVKEESKILWSREQRSALKWEKENGAFDLFDGYRYQATTDNESINKLKNILSKEGFTGSLENNYSRETAEKKSYIHENGFRCALTSKENDQGGKDIELSCAE